MAKLGKSVFLKGIRQEELMGLRQTIKESIHQRKLKDFKRLVQQYFLVLRPKTGDK